MSWVDPRLSRRLLLVGAMAGAMVGAGCQPQSSSKGDDKPPPSASALVPVDILIDWQAEPTYLGVYYAKRKGYFAKVGYQATVTQSWGANQAVAAVASGKNIIGTASGGATVLGHNNGAKVVSLGVLYPRIPTVIYGLSSSGIRAPADLKGKRIGIYPGSVTVNEFDAFLKLNNLKPSDVKVVSLSGADIPLLVAGKVDAVLHYTEMSPVQVETSPEIKGPSPKTFELRLADYGVGGYGLNIIANQEAWQKQRPKLQALSAAIEQGYRDGCASPADAVNEFIKEFPDKNREYVTQSWNKVCQLVGKTPGAQNSSGWDDTIKIYKSLGLLKADVKSTEILGN